MENQLIENENHKNIKIVIDNIALIYTADKKESGLINLTTNKLVSEMDNFYTIYDKDGHFFYQKKEIEGPNQNNKYNTVYAINIYDTLKEQMIIKNAIFTDSIYNYSLLILKKDENYYIFDEILYRQGIDTLKYPFSFIELLRDKLDIRKNLLVVTLDNKKGLYLMRKGLITATEYQEITPQHSVIIFAKNNQKYFSFEDNPSLLSNAFDDIAIKEIEIEPFSSTLLMYCRINDLYYVYNLNNKKLLLKIKCEEIECIMLFDKKCIFKIKKDGRYGLISVLNYPVDKIEVKTLLIPIYKNINYEKGYTINYYPTKNSLNIFYLENIDGINLYTLNTNTLIKENCSKINYLGYYSFAFYHGLNCDIISLEDSFKVIINNCLIKEKIENRDIAIIYKKNCMLGLLIITDEHYYLIDANYTKVNYLGYGFSILEENDKKRLFHYNKCLTQKCDDIKVANYSECRYYGPAYAALNRNNSWLLAELKNDGYNVMSIKKFNDRLYTEILFFHDVIALRNTEKLEIYNSQLELLATYPQETIIYEVKTDASIYVSDYMYVIDDWYYQYKNNQLEEIFLEDAFLNACAYGSDFGYVVVNDYNKDKYYEKSAKIGNFTQGGIDKLLEDYLLKRSDLQAKYPHLVRQKKGENHEN